MVELRLQMNGHALISLAVIGLLTLGVRSQAFAAPPTKSAEVQKFVIEPRAVTVMAGASLTVSPYFPSALVTGVQWSATGGTISSTGVYTAPPTPGAYVITATVGGVSSTVTVNVVTSGSPASQYAAASSACAAFPIRSTGTKFYFCDCQSGAQGGCVPGNDANAGTAPTAPKRSFAQVVSRIGSMAAGDTIALCKGGSWTTTGRNVLQPTQCRAGSTPITDPANSGTCDIRDYAAAWGGTNRPLVTQASDTLFSFQGGSPDAGIRILNLNLNGSGGGSGSTEAGTNAIWLYGPHTDYFICNNVFDQWGAALNLQSNANGAVSRVAFRGNRVLNGAVFGFLGAGNDSQLDANFWDDNGVSNKYDHTIYVSAHYPTTGMSITNNEILFSATRRNFQGVLLPGAGTTCQGVQVVVHGALTRLNLENNIVDGGVGAGGGCWGIGAGSGGYAETEYNDSMTIRRNIVKRTGHTAIILDQAQNSIVENNIVWLDQGEGTGIALAQSATNTAKDRRESNVTVRNNTVYITSIGNGSGSGIRTWAEGTGYVVANNSVFFTVPGATCFTTAGAFDFIGNNACFNGTWGTSLDGTTRVTANPLYTNAPTDFTPQVGSPLNGAGSATRAPATDINLKARPSPPSIGAVER